jgi:hypothetical protein
MNKIDLQENVLTTHGYTHPRTLLTCETLLPPAAQRLSMTLSKSPAFIVPNFSVSEPGPARIEAARTTLYTRPVCRPCGIEAGHWVSEVSGKFGSLAFVSLLARTPSGIRFNISARSRA